MNTTQRNSFSARCLQTTLAVLLLVPTAAQAQNYNTATGFEALFNNTTGNENTADGWSTLYHNTTGSYNTATGFESLFNNTTGNGNTAAGWLALYANTTGGANTASGLYALYSNTTGNYNTAIGDSALYYNTTGSNNTANGYWTLLSNTTGYNNTATGWAALFYNTTGSNNTANGYQAVYANTTGNDNTADGLYALLSNTTGSNNTAAGCAALSSNTTGTGNIALGYQAGSNITTGGSNIAIGNQGTTSDNGVIRIGTLGTQTATYIAGINGFTVSKGIAVYINARGQLGTPVSSRRFKQDIHDMGGVSEKLMQLRPVTFRYNDKAEKGPHELQYGLIAEEVAKVYPDLVQYDQQGKPFTIYYHLLTPMLLNEFQKERRRTVALQTTFAAQQTRIAALGYNNDSFILGP